MNRILLHMKSMMKLMLLGCVLAMPLFVVNASLQAPTASAGFISGVKGFFQLPGEVDKLQDQYQVAKQQLEDATKQLDSVSRESKEALQQVKDSEQKLLQENVRLAQQNVDLQQSILKLQQAEQERSSKYRRTMIMIFTAAGLILLYFVLGRVLRVVLRSR